jgi:transcriptional regulator with XRE-family HTH domain
VRTEPDELMRAVGRRIAQLRGRAGRTQEEFAVALGVSARWVRRVEEEGQNLTLLTLAKLANTLDVNVAALLREPSANAKMPGPGRPRKRRKGRAL